MTDCPKTDIYKWIRRNQTYLSTKERVNIIELLLYDVNKNFGLKNEEWDQIIDNIKKPPKFCQHVILDSGRKCLQPISNENKCKKHF